MIFNVKYKKKTWDNEEELSETIEAKSPRDARKLVLRKKNEELYALMNDMVTNNNKPYCLVNSPKYICISSVTEKTAKPERRRPLIEYYDFVITEK